MNQTATLLKNTADRLPVSIVTGFLGSGKTTLLNHLVQQPEMGKVAVLINEFGEIGLDHLLVETISDEIILLQSGCICCQMSGDFVSTLIDLYEKRLAGEIDAFTHVLVETTGIADPGPIIQTLLSNSQLLSHYRLGTVIATLDTVFAESQLRLHREAVRQVSFADKLLFCKADLSDQAQRDSLARRVRKLNARAPVSVVTGGRIAADEVFLSEPQITDRNDADISDWLGVPQSEFAAPVDHSGAISSFCVTLDGALDWNEFVAWADALLSSRSRQILRFKGMLNINGRTGPVIVQAVHNILYAPMELQQWPAAEIRSTMVFFCCDLSASAVRKSLDQFFAAGRSIAPGTADKHV